PRGRRPPGGASSRSSDPQGGRKRPGRGKHGERPVELAERRERRDPGSGRLVSLPGRRVTRGGSLSWTAGRFVSSRFPPHADGNGTPRLGGALCPAGSPRAAATGGVRTTGG